MEINEKSTENEVDINQTKKDEDNMQEVDPKESTNNNSDQKGPLKIKIKFILFGFSSLVAWSTIVTKLSFFNFFVPNLRPYESLSFLNFALNIVLQFIVLWKKDLFKLKHQILFGLIGSIIFLFIIPTSIIFLKNNENLNVCATVVLILLMGLINAFSSSSFLALASFFPMEMIICFSVGQGISAISMNLVEYIILGTVDYGDQEKNEIVGVVILFSVTLTILIITLITILLSYNTDYFKKYMEKKENDNNQSSDSMNEPSVKLLGQEDMIVNKQKMSFYEMFKLLKDIDLLIAFLFAVTFMLYPIGFSEMHLFNLDDKYYMNTILFMYNVCATAGRYLVKCIKATKKITYIIILSRAILIFSILINFSLQKSECNDVLTGILTIFNVISLGFTNGMGNTLCFGIAPTLVQKEFKGQAGASVSFFTIIGIFLGSCLAFATGSIKRAISS